MNISIFNQSLADSLTLMDKLELLKMRGIKVINEDGLSEQFRRILLQESYGKIYRMGKENLDFDCLLIDDSYFQFEFQKLESGKFNLRYAFYQNPQLFVEYDEYQKEFMRREQIDEDEIPDWEPYVKEYYDQFLLEQELNSGSVPIRYEVDVVNYKPQIHSYSHLHIGNFTNIRIPCDKYLTPLKFVLFVIKHVYYNIWRKCIQTENAHLLEALETAKRNCVKLTIDQFNVNEKLELYLE